MLATNWIPPPTTPEPLPPLPLSGSPLDDRTLVAEAAAGSREAFDELVRRYHRQTYNLALSLTEGDGEAEDLVQETFVRAFRAIGRFRQEASFQTWLYRIAVNVIRSHVGRRARRLEILPPHTGSGESDSPTDRLESGEDLEATISCRQLIDRALATLSEEVRLLVTLRDVHGLEYHEIASVTGLPIGTVESRVFRARQRLRPLLQPLVRTPADTKAENVKRKIKL